MANRETGNSSKKRCSVMPHCKRHNIAFDILDIYFSAERDATRIDVECSVCHERLGFLYSTAGFIFLASRMRTQEADAAEWQALPSLQCENCTRELTVQDIYVSDNGDLLFEYRCFACGNDRIYDHEFSREKRISWASAMRICVKTEELISDETRREQPVFADGGDRINVGSTRPN